MDILRGRRVRKSSSRAIRFTSSIEFDSPITRHVVKINMAHMLSLVRAKAVSGAVGASCLRFLDGLPEGLELDPETEDVHHMVEQLAIKSIGMEAAGFMNFGKSRNDQVATALRMEARERVLLVCEAISSVQESLVRLASRSGSLPIPGYTHLQHAQPVTVAHHLQAYFDAFQRDFERMVEAYARVNLSPMGAAALAGSSVPVDRRRTASLLGFDGLVRNSMDAVSSRDFALELMALCEITMVDLSRLAEEVILWSSSEFGFVEVADEHAATSSIMPQKKNPVVAETVRAKCGSVLGRLTAACSILKALPNSYNLDLQEVNPHLWGALSDTLASLQLTGEMVSGMRFKRGSLASSLEDDGSTATELANHLVKRYGVPFREAHAIVGELARVSADGGSSFKSTAVAKLPDVSKRVTGRRLNVEGAEVERVLDVEEGLRLIRTTGGANPNSAASQARSDRTAVGRNKAWVKRVGARLREAEMLLKAEAETAMGEVKS